MRLPALLLFVLPALLPAGAAAQATLNKCIDAEGRVTYSNLPCRGARDVQKLEIDPPPVSPPRAPAPATPPAPPPAAPVPAPATGPATVPPSVPQAAERPSTPGPVEPAPSPVPPRAPAAVPVAPLPATSPPARATPQPAPPQAARPTAVVTPRTCDALSEQLGRVLDKMDAARGKGVSPQQQDAWSKEIQALERKKTEAGCF